MWCRDGELPVATLSAVSVGEIIVVVGVQASSKTTFVFACEIFF